MNDGIAALSGAALGAVGAWVAALVAFRGARYQADTQARSAREQWLREVRRELYAEFLAKAREVNEGFRDAVILSTNRDALGISFATVARVGDFAHERLLTAKKAADRMRLEAPRGADGDSV